jgi:hypothetical protein
MLAISALGAVPRIEKQNANTKKAEIIFFIYSPPFYY